MLERFARLLPTSINLQVYGVVVLLFLEVATVLAVLIWPQDTRLAMAKDVGTTLLGFFGFERANHASRAIWAPGDAPGPPPLEGK